MSDIDDLLDERMVGSSGDYPPWFDEDPKDGDHNQGTPPIQGNEGDRLTGIVTQVRDDPFYDPSEEEEPKPILHVQDAEGNEWSTRTHVTLVDLIRKQEPEVGDLVRIEYSGTFKTDRGQVANDYQLGVVRRDELDDVDWKDADSSSDTGSTTETEEPEPEPEPGPSEDEGFDPEDFTVSEIENLVATVDDVSELEDMFMAETTGPDRKTAKAHIQNRKEELESSGGTEDEATEESADGADIDGEVIEFVTSLLSFHGELTFDELDEYLNDTRDFGVEPSAVAAALDDVEVDGDTVRQAG